ncbi:MAG: 30S ribosomal protein S2 [Chloroflexi bacterium]|nr:30S ribosomal protein S2 [Chloroflexota bacterium]MCI0773255.1 30S ribosomal protein S2 [Chloroflexota bacterium]MCI0806731.1 30S ribosomal protein S2 [Chloroflexota bacterium]MCI0827771.1 30S ribosomal protein S2 [Chloroflexota bacterium]MCI0854234.1 30S ribosomal protein S2 [Chloroflexota bacterium]
MVAVSMKDLLETGVHFGHRTRKWNPRMRPFIFTERNNIHIIDLQQTLDSLIEACALIRDTVAGGGNILFLGTKRQAQETIELEARRCGMPYVNMRWLGGTLTNWQTIRSRIDELTELERRKDEGELDLLTKKEALTVTRRIDKLEERLGGIREMKTVPDLLYAVDVRRAETAIHEANLLNIPVIALVDTNCDPSGVDYVIPSNDDAIRAIKLLTSTIADAALEGMELRKDSDVEDEQIVPKGQELAASDISDEELLGEATLAKLQTGDFDEKLPATEDEAKTEEVVVETSTPADDEDQAGAEAADIVAEDDSAVDAVEAAAEVEEPQAVAEEDAEAEEAEDAAPEEEAEEAAPEGGAEAEQSSEAGEQGKQEEEENSKPEDE